MQERLLLCPLCRDRGQDILNVFMKQLTEHDKVAPFVALQSKNEWGNGKNIGWLNNVGINQPIKVGKQLMNQSLNQAINQTINNSIQRNKSMNR